jgi:hypothetical protein
VDRQTAEHLFEVINSREDVLRRLIRKCAYLKYVEARLGDRILYADEILRDGFCVNMIDTPLCPLKVVTNLQEAVWDADIVIAGLPSTEIRHVFQQVGRYWRERRTMPIIISLAKGVEAALQPHPHIITPTQMIVETSMRSLRPISVGLLIRSYRALHLALQLLTYSSNGFFYGQLVFHRRTSCTWEGRTSPLKSTTGSTPMPASVARRGGDDLWPISCGSRISSFGTTAISPPMKSWEA